MPNDISPTPWLMRLGSTVKNWGPRKLLSLKSFSNKGMGVMLDPPKLLCQHCLIHQTEFLKTKTTCAPRLANPIPINIMHFSNPLVMTPPEVPCYSIHLIANTLRTRKQEKVYKGKEWSRVYEGGSASLWEQSCLPPLELRFEFFH